MSAKKLIDLLEKNSMLDDSVIKEVRKLVADSKSTVSAEAVAKALVDKGHLTKFQATKLISSVTAKKEASKEARAKTRKQRKQEDEELGFVDDDDASNELVPDGGDEVVMLEEGDGEVVGLTPVEDAAGGLTPVGAPPAPLTPLPDQGLTPLDDGSGLSPLTEMGGDGDFDPFGTAQPAAGQAQPQPGKPAPGSPGGNGPRKVHRTRWDSKLMLGGGFALIIISILGVLFYLSISTAPAVEMWDMAMEDYRSESYAQAMDRFQDFVEDYPEDPNASEAKVRINFCLIRAVVATPQKGLERAKELLPPVATEKSFSIVRPELGRLLLQIPDGFIKKAKATENMAEKEELADRADEAMKDLVLNSTYVPTSIKESIRREIQETTEDIARIRRDVNRDKDLQKTIVEIDSKLGADDTVGAFAAFKALIKDYPGLERDGTLVEAVKRITALEGGLVKVTDAPISPLGAEGDGASGHARIVLTTLEGEGSTRVENRVATILAGGSVYGLDAGKGNVLWSRVVGYGNHFHPVRLTNQPDADVVLVDRQELVRLKAASGEVVYRVPAGADITFPSIAGDKIYVPTVDGRILEVATETGESPRHVSIPQKLSTGPGVAGNLPLLFQPGDHSNLYAIATDSLTCKDVYYFGHREGTIAVPPVVLMGHVFVAENAGPDFCWLHVLKIDTDGERLLQTAQPPLRLKGNVIVPLQAYGSRLLAVTDRSDVRVLNINVNAEENPVEPAATKSGYSDQTMVTYPLTNSGTLWLADDRLAKYDIQVTTKDINLRENVSVGDAFVAPLQLHGDLLVLARRRGASAGIVISAVSIDRPRRAVWESHVGVPAARVAVNAEKKLITVITAGAALFNIDQDARLTGLNDKPEMVARSATPAPLAFTEVIELASGHLALFNPGDPSQILTYDPTKASRQLSIQTLDLAGATVTSTPIMFQGSLVFPTDTGDVRLIDPASGKDATLPFQPTLSPGEKLKWLRPTAVGDGGEFVIANNRREIYRLAVKDTVKPALAASATGQLDVDLVAQLAAIDDVVYGVVHTTAGDVLKAISVTDLTAGDDIDLQGTRVTWGPQRVGDAVMLITDNKQLRCYQADKTARWEKPAVAHGMPAGLPLEVNGDFVFASRDGTVWKVAGATGEELGKTVLDEPLAVGPIALGGRLMLCGSDGTLHIVPAPTATPAP